MAAALVHRGPDEQVAVVDQNVGFAHARLEIVAPGRPGRQPMEGASGRWLLNFNGEVFNHAELRDQLPAADYVGHSDTETLLHVLDAWDEDGIERCNGLFAFAALDRLRRRVLLVRDRFGVKPLYFARVNGSIWFASEIGALLAGGVPRQPRPEVLTEALRRGWLDGRDTPIRDVERVPPGTIIEISLDTLAVTERRWFEPGALVNPDYASELSGMSRADLADQLEQVLRRSVRRRLMADAELGTMCSGGVDSSLITAYAADEKPGLTAFHASVADGFGVDERRWAEQVAKALGIELEVASISGATWRAGLVNAVRHFGYPLPNPSAVGISMVSRLAHERGVRVLLVGEAADELFGGYRDRHKTEYRDFLPLDHRLWQEADLLRQMGPRPYARKSWRHVRKRLRRVTGRGGRQKVPNPLWAETQSTQASRSRDAHEQAVDLYRHHARDRAPLEGALLADLECGPLPQLLNRMDKNAMQHSVETRLPYLDPEVLALAVNLPLEARIGPQPKGILRDAALARLPKRVARRPKQGGPLFDAGSFLDSAARPDFLEQGVLREVLGVPAPAWRSALAARPQKRKVHWWTAEIWCRLFLDDRPVSEVEAELWPEQQVMGAAGFEPATSRV